VRLVLAGCIWSMLPMANRPSHALPVRQANTDWRGRRWRRYSCRTELRGFLSLVSQAFHESEPRLQIEVGMLPPRKFNLTPGKATQRPLSASVGSTRHRLTFTAVDFTGAMIPAFPNGTDVWMSVPPSSPLRMTIRACLDNSCEECGMPVYRCESEAGQMLRLCASHLRLPN
jgi:hypothetical protein